MQAQLLFFAMTPAIVFALLHGRTSLRNAVVAVIATAVLEALVNSVALGRAEPFSLASLVLFAALGARSLRAADGRWLALQPAALDLLLAVAFAWAYFGRGVPLFAVILEEHVGLFELLPAYQQGYARMYATTLSRSLPFLFLLHAAWAGWAAWRRSLRVWLGVRVLGFYGLLALFFLAERLLQVQP